MGRGGDGYVFVSVYVLVHACACMTDRDHNCVCVSQRLPLCQRGNCISIH